LIAYDSDVAGPVEVFVMRSDGRQKRRLTHGGQNDEPRWSPDGRRIAYVHGGCSNTGCSPATRSSLWIMNANGSGQRRLTSGRSVDNDPRWSPDGRWIAFTRGTACTSNGCRLDIWLIRPNGTGARPLTRNGGSAEPSWSPDGKQIAFDGPSADGMRWDLYVMNADGKGARDLTAKVSNPNLSVARPAWSPDGQWIMYTPFGYIGSTLTFISPGGTQGKTLNMHNGDDVSEPSWSPDGKWIVYETQQTLWVTDFATFRKSRRVAFNGDNHNPDWQPLPQRG
jgi:TolB protein